MIAHNPSNTAQTFLEMHQKLLKMLEDWLFASIMLNENVSMVVLVRNANSGIQKYVPDMQKMETEMVDARKAQIAMIFIPNFVL